MTAQQHLPQLSTGTDYESLAAELGMRVGSIGPTRARCFDRLRAELDRLGIHADDLN